jgi:hypothetical protein
VSLRTSTTGSWLRRTAPNTYFGYYVTVFAEQQYQMQEPVLKTFSYV